MRISEITAAIPGVIGRVQIGPQIGTANVRDALDAQDAERRYFFPLRHGLLGDAQRRRQPRKAASFLDRRFKCFVHGYDVKHDFKAKSSRPSLTP